MGRIPIHVFQHNHFDPLWQRCWNRTFDYRGRRYRSYADVQEYVIDRWLENAKRGAAFTEGQAVVLRKYLERNPDRLDEVRGLVRNGQIELLASGEIVCDTNLPSGETLLRNFVLGQRYFEDTFGTIPSIGSLEDAFGHSAQLPQLLRGAECSMVTGLSRKQVPGTYWKGLDGSVVFTGRLPSVRHVGHWRKIPPCPACCGRGCAECGGRGLADAAGLADEDIWRELTSDWGGASVGVLELGGEEAVPNLHLPDLIERARTKLGLDVRMGILALLSSHFADAVARVDDAALEVSDQLEANCVFTGCYVSRIKTKQDLRRIEHLVNTAERWATMAFLQGADYPSQDLLSAWRHTVFLAFHDAVTGTHLDQPYDELVDMQQNAERAAGGIIDRALTHIEERIATTEGKQYLVVYNSESWERSDPVTARAPTYGVPVLASASGDRIDVLDASAAGGEFAFTFRTPIPALGYAVLEMDPDSSPADSGGISEGPGDVENDYYRVLIGDGGIESILDKRAGREMSHPGYLVNELLLEEDRGDPWGTMDVPPPAERLGSFTAQVKVRRARNASEVTWWGQYGGGDSGITTLSWRQSMILFQGYDRIDFYTTIAWDGRNRRIRVAMPTGLKKGRAFYSIPYGALMRSSYEPEMNAGVATNGDWPAVYWVDVFDDEQCYGVALLNAGTPSHKVEDGVVFLSLLRSPAELWSVSEADYDYCLDFDGVRDAGSHQFRYSLVPHRGDFRSAGIEKRGREFNNPLICRSLKGSGTGSREPAGSLLKMNTTEHVIVTALKKGERDDAIVVRLAETAGEPGLASPSISGNELRASLVNYLERNPQPVSGAIRLAPFKVLTVRLE